MKSTIKRVENISFHQASGNYYHDLEMENGDQINIGKKKKYDEGQELEYEIVGEGHEYNKAKTPFNQQPSQGYSKPSSTQSRPDNVQLMIVRQSSLTRAIETLTHHKADFDKDEVIAYADVYAKWVMS